MCRNPTSCIPSAIRLNACPCSHSRPSSAPAGSGQACSSYSAGGSTPVSGCSSSRNRSSGCNQGVQQVPAHIHQSHSGHDWSLLRAGPGRHQGAGSQRGLACGDGLQGLPQGCQGCKVCQLLSSPAPCCNLRVGSLYAAVCHCQQCKEGCKVPVSRQVLHLPWAMPASMRHSTAPAGGTAPSCFELLHDAVELALLGLPEGALRTGCPAAQHWWQADQLQACRMAVAGSSAAPRQMPTWGS